ncbi:FGGY-family carbohydrate kinase [Pseudaestuariivita rosea]|uniref:FGGY-family carbohydrate kinase n=1 Tax=Pseudaestuariivita rosea TaxID=2763263 RepID=UPI001ABBDC67
MSADPVFIGIDVGTGSARAGLFDQTGTYLSHASSDIQLFQMAGGIAEQSSADIWRAVCASVRAAMDKAGVTAERVAGLGFDATCSMVVVGPGDDPVTISSSGDPARDVIVWMDHRAVEQAERINDQDHDVLKYVGGRISPEMQTPKLLWLKENLPNSYQQAAHFFDLVDYLTWRATGQTTRSTCTVTCKWTYLAHEGRWDAGYFEQLGLGDLAVDSFARIGSSVLEPGRAIPGGLGQSAAGDMGLTPETPVAIGLIDAHAGGVGTVGGRRATDRMAYVFGTSACTMTSTIEPAFVPGVWGPYFSAMVPGLWLNEGGQSAAGAAIARLIDLHPGHREAKQKAQDAGKSVAKWLADTMPTNRNTLIIAGDLTVVPDFNGNRSPHADPHARAVIAGLSTDTDIESLRALYAAGLLGIGYGLRQIIETQAVNGIQVDEIVISGGAGAHPFVRQAIADATGVQVVLPTSPEPVLLGSAMLAATASGFYRDVPDAMENMSSDGAVVYPHSDRGSHDERYNRFLALQTAAAQ